MPIYGEPDLGITYTFVAVAPITAEHPIGSGTVVTYKPGDVFPGEEWGNAAHNLVEVGKAVRLATNIEVPTRELMEDNGVEFVAESTGSYIEIEEVASVEVTSYPVATGSGWFTLSDGSRIRGEEAASSAQAELDAS